MRRESPVPVLLPETQLLANDEKRATLLLKRYANGDERAGGELLPLLYEELHELARRFMGGQRADHTLQPTALVNEAWVKLFAGDPATWNDRAHFLGVAARAMRQVLVDHARSRAAAKRKGGRTRVALDAALEFYEADGIDLLDLDAALAELGAEDPELLRMVELRFFGGLTVHEAAELLGVSHRRLERGWVFARTWLYRRLRGEERGS